MSVHYVHDPRWPFCLYTACKFIVLLPVCCQIEQEPITAKASRLSVTLHLLSTLFFQGTSGSSSLLAVQSPDVYIWPIQAFWLQIKLEMCWNLKYHTCYGSEELLCGTWWRFLSSDLNNPDKLSPVSPVATGSMLSPSYCCHYPRQISTGESGTDADLSRLWTSHGFTANDPLSSEIRRGMRLSRKKRFLSFSHYGFLNGDF